MKGVITDLHGQKYKALTHLYSHATPHSYIFPVLRGIDRIVIRIVSNSQLHFKMENEATMQLLRTSRVMRQNEITIQESQKEAESDLSDIEMNEFEATENLTSQNFHTIRDLVTKRRTIWEIIGNDSGSNAIPNCGK